MQERTKPPFRADHVGSLIRPDALLKARAAAEKGEIDRAELTLIQHDAIRDVVRMQEDLGLRLVTDGEFNRFSWQRDFLLKLNNVALIPSRLSVRFHSAAGTRYPNAPPIIYVTGSEDVRIAVAALKAGAVDFIEKPFSDEVLLNAIQSALACASSRPAKSICTSMRLSGRIRTCSPQCGLNSLSA